MKIYLIEHKDLEFMNAHAIKIGNEYFTEDLRIIKEDNINSETQSVKYSDIGLLSFRKKLIQNISTKESLLSEIKHDINFAESIVSILDQKINGEL